MPLWFWLVVGLALLGLLLLLVVPLRLELSAEARAEPDGQWAFAAGVALGPVAVSGVAARGISPSLQLFVRGKRRFSRQLPGAEPDPAEAEVGSGEARRAPRPHRLAGWLQRRFDPIDGLAWLLAERKRLRWQLDVDVGYSFRDVALTGKVLGGVYLLLPLLPRGIRLRQTPSWDSADRGAVQVSGTLSIFAGLVLCDLIWYMLKRSLTARRLPRVEPTSQAWPKAKSSTS